MDISAVALFSDDRMFIGFAVFYFFIFWSIYLCIAVLLWRGMIKTDSVVFYMPLLPAKEIRFCEIDFVHDTDNNTYGLGGQKMLTAYHGGKKLFSIEEDVIGYLFLRALLYDSGKVEYVPVMENPTDEKTMKRAPVVEDFSVTSKTGDKVRTVVSFLILAPLSVYILWDRADFGLGYQIIAAGMLLGILLDLFSELLWKVTVDFRTISIRNILGIVKTYEMRQITKVVEQEQHIVLYAGQKKMAKIAKCSKNFQLLFERLWRMEVEIQRKY